MIFMIHVIHPEYRRFHRYGVKKLFIDGFRWLAPIKKGAED